MSKQKTTRILDPHFDWQQVARLVLTSRAIDTLEEKELYPAKKIVYQFSARGHELTQVLLGLLLNHPRDCVSAYYRSRPMLLTLGLSIEDALAGPLAKSGSFSDGRDIGVVCNLPSAGGATVIPMAGEVGSQYTPAAGWAQSIRYYRETLKDESYHRALAAVLGGEGSVATNGFWSALVMATTLGLPMVFLIEDNGFAISVPADKQTPGGNIAANLRSFKNLHLIDGDGADPADAASCIAAGVNFVRSGETPVLIRLRVPRLCGHSGQDSQAYKPEGLIAEERANDPLPALKKYLIPTLYSEEEWKKLEAEVTQEVADALEKALQRSNPDPTTIERFAFAEYDENGKLIPQAVGGLVGVNLSLPPTTEVPSPEPVRINMLEGICRTLKTELKRNERMLLFGEDVGPKGGVHAATMGLQEEFGEARVFDTSLSEEGIIGRAVGMAFAGLFPVAEIQFRKYADPAMEQLINAGTIRWRTANKFAAPLVVRLAGGFSKRAGDPWHSVCGEAVFLHQTGWMLVFPSNAEDAVGLLRASLRANDPVIFFEHRALLDAPEARRGYPGDDYLVPLGKARLVTEGDELTVVTWGAMVERCKDAASALGRSIEILDLRTLCPWDKEAVLASVEKTKRCLIVHEDTPIAGFGAEIAAHLVAEAFYSLDAPVQRVTPPPIPVPFSLDLMNVVVPTVERIRAAMESLLGF